MRRLDLKREAGLLARFGGAGVLTTALGLTVILALDVGLGLDRRLANAVGYLAGAWLGLVLQKTFVFRQAAHAPGATVRYVAVMLFAFALNQATLTLAGAALPQDRLGHTLAQLVAMGTYTATQFALFRLWVFRPAKSMPSAAERRRRLEALSKSATAKASAGPAAARNQDFLYGEDGLPK